MESNFKDTYFLDAETALKEAKKQNKIMCTITVEGLQICYYNGKKIKNSPKNFICVPFEKLTNYFSKTKNRFPTQINFDNTQYSEEEKDNIRKIITSQINEATTGQQLRTEKYLKKIKQLNPDFKDKKLRVFVPACRETVVMQHMSKIVADAFKQNKYDVKYFIQKNDMQSCGSAAALKAHYKFNPHITITINHLSNSYLSSSIFNVIWFQDPMPILTNSEKIQIRDRDIFFSYQSLFDTLLIKKGVPKSRIHRQYVSNVDTAVFFEDSTIKRENKIVFVGSHYSLKDSSTLPSFLEYNESIYYDLIELIEKGKDLSENNILQIFKKHKQEIHAHPNFINMIQHGMIRNITVNWMCHTNEVPIELYGYYWDELNIENINKVFKGPISKEQTQKLYNSSRYVLLASGAVINTQRLAEVVMCGAIPVMYDSRNITDEKETWDKECLYFKTKKDLDDILKYNKVPEKFGSKKLKKSFTFDKLVSIIEKNISKHSK